LLLKKIMHYYLIFMFVRVKYCVHNGMFIVVYFPLDLCELPLIDCCVNVNASQPPAKTSSTESHAT
jgi:hypothetical protein